MKGLWAKKQAKGKRSNQFEPQTAERLQRETAVAGSRRSELDKDNNQVIKTLFNTIISLQFCTYFVNLTKSLNSSRAKLGWFCSSSAFK